MITFNNNLKEQINLEFEELEKYKNSYLKKIDLYNVYIDNIKKFEENIVEKNNLNIRELEIQIESFKIQIDKIDINIELLNIFNDNIDTINKEQIEKYNHNNSEIQNNYINNSISEEDITAKYVNGLMSGVTNSIENTKDCSDNFQSEKETDYYDVLKNNDTLLISEKLGKVLLPYRADEVLEIFNNENENNKYQSCEDVIEDKFTRKFSDYKAQFSSRYTETMKLARDREKYNMIDSIAISLEMMRNKYLHPAIISACRNLNELDTYLDCLAKNELDDFKIFKIKYELYPIYGKKCRNKLFKRILRFV